MECPFKYDWYQSESTICINVLVKNVKTENIRMDITEKTLVCSIKMEDGDLKSMKLNFLEKVQPNTLSWKVRPTKIEIKLTKTEGIQWKSLIDDSSKSKTQGDVTLSYPSSLPKKKDWDRLAHEIALEEENEKLDGETEVNKLFKKIYAEGSDETRRAMNKSFMESGGTVLSTNWKEIQNKKTEVKPPDGVEFRKWDS